MVHGLGYMGWGTCMNMSTIRKRVAHDTGTLIVHPDAIEPPGTASMTSRETSQAVDPRARGAMSRSAWASIAPEATSCSDSLTAPGWIKRSRAFREVPWRKAYLKLNEKEPDWPSLGSLLRGANPPGLERSSWT